MMIKSIVTYSDIILYWNLNDCKNEKDVYYVFLNGEFVIKTDKTHITIRNINLKSNEISIYLDENKHNLFYNNKFELLDKPRIIDITKAPYNAVGDGKTLNTFCIQKAIDDCGEGECVYIPKGEFLTGALQLHSHMELYIEKDGALLGSTLPSDYLPKIHSRFEGLEMECYSSMINMGNIDNRDEYCLENVLIHGGGRICGGGLTLAKNVLETEKIRLKEYMESLGDEIKTYENLNTIPGRLRPKLINISCSKNVVMDNIEFSNGACWNIHMIYSDNIVTCNSSICSKDVWNGDGWDPDSSTNCTIFNCDFNTGDDCIAIKSGKNPEGNIIGKPCENVNIFDCRCIGGHGIALGSEMSGGISDVHIWDCDFSDSIFGCHIKATKKRGGYIKNVHISDCVFPRLAMHSVGYNDDGARAAAPPIFSDCVFERLTILGEAMEWGETEIKPCDAVELVGFDDGYEIRNIILKDIVIDCGRESQKNTISLQRLKNISFINLVVR